jgi:hypothetical protein
MRAIRQLDQASTASDGSFSANSSATDGFNMGFDARRLGDYAELAFYSGAVEMTLRVRAAELFRALRIVTAAMSGGVSRTLGTGQSEILFTASEDGGLLLRPRLTTDAMGSIALYFSLTGGALASFTAWVDALHG